MINQTYNDTGLLIVGHGSTENPDSALPYYQQANQITEQGLFAEVHCSFWKEEPSCREAYYLFDSEKIYVVPVFISEGYFTKQVIPRELELNSRTSFVHNKTIHYCDPVGIHASMTKCLADRVQTISPVPLAPEETSIIIVGHGTGLDVNSAQAIKNQVNLLKQRYPKYALITDAYMEEAPLIKNWKEITSSPNVIVVPFFISDGLHSYQDIPVLLGLVSKVEAPASQRKEFHYAPKTFNQQTLYFSNAIGNNPLIAKIITDQVQYFDDHYLGKSILL